VTSVVNGKDVIPRLSAGGVDRLLGQLSDFGSLPSPAELFGRLNFGRGAGSGGGSGCGGGGGGGGGSDGEAACAGAHTNTATTSAVQQEKTEEVAAEEEAAAEDAPWTPRSGAVAAALYSTTGGGGGGGGGRPRSGTVERAREMYPPGQLLHIDDTCSAVREPLLYRVTDVREAYLRILVCGHLLEDHLASGYSGRLGRIFDGMCAAEAGPRRAFNGNVFSDAEADLGPFGDGMTALAAVRQMQERVRAMHRLGRDAPRASESPTSSRAASGDAEAEAGGGGGGGGGDVSRPRLQVPPPAL
jgi:hypothetical protein